MCVIVVVSFFKIFFRFTPFLWRMMRPVLDYRLCFSATFMTNEKRIHRNQDLIIVMASF